MGDLDWKGECAVFYEEFPLYGNKRINELDIRMPVSDWMKNGDIKLILL